MEKVVQFLKELSENNNREWFNDNRLRYQESKDKVLFLIEILINEIKVFDPEIAGVNPKDCMYRIFRDVRFSKDKRPYKTNFGAFIAKGGRKSIYPGYFFHIEADESFFGGGVYMPQPGPLKAIRNYIAENGTEFLEIINAPEFKKIYPEMYDHQLKTAPRGFPKDHEFIGLLKYKSFVFAKRENNRIIKENKIVDDIMQAYRQLHNANIFLREAMEKIR
jgi:uncharacterized protein (TIGR02453 family)